jgi:DNA-binding winged helix-turn-helix (wHTH) protein/tetratricopeptide (TPR) repeat protein
VGVLRFEGFTLDRSGPVPSLKCGGTDIPLRPQALKVLAYLADRPGHAVSNNELIENCWEEGKRKDTRVNSVAQCIKEIRDALGETKRPIVRTVPRQGYVFVAPFSAMGPALADDSPTAVPQAPAEREAAARPVSAWPSSAATLLGTRLRLAAVSTVTIAAVAWLVWSWAARPAEPTMMAEPSIIILPAPPLGNDGDKALASLAGEIATGIWRAPRGFKPNIRPANAIKDAGRDPMAIGREAGARYVVRTMARREAEVMHVNIEVVEAETGQQVWLGAFQYRPGEVGGQYRAAARIGRTLAAELLRAEARRPLPARVEAGHLVILGRSLMNDERSAKTNGEAIALFERAIALDGENFLALGNFARATADHFLNGWAPASERASRLAKAEEAINKAIKLEPKSPGALLSRGGVLRARGDYPQAIAAFEEALLLNPNFANAHAELGRVMIDVGEPQKTAEYVHKALDLNPDDFARYIWCYWAGLAALYRDQPGEALKWLRQSHEANRQYDNALRLMAVAYAHAGDDNEARKKMDEFRRKRPDATLADWWRPESVPHPNIAKEQARIRETMKRLGLPAGNIHAAAQR